MASKKKRKKIREQKKIDSRLAKLQSEKTSKSQKRRAREYLKNKGFNQRVNLVPNKLSKNQLEEWKAKLEPMVTEANHRIEMIQMSGYTSYALDRVIQEGGRDYFDLSEINNREDLLKEITRMRVFINDKGSSMQGAKLQTAQIYAEKYRGKFGNQYNTKEYNYARYDIKAIDSEIAKRAFATYRRIEEHRATEIVSDGAYGSENLIIALYDAEVRGLDSLVYGEELLDAFVESSNTQWNNVRRDIDNITAISGIIEDNITGRRVF